MTAKIEPLPKPIPGYPTNRHSDPARQRGVMLQDDHEAGPSGTAHRDPGPAPIPERTGAPAEGGSDDSDLVNGFMGGGRFKSWEDLDAGIDKMKAEEARLDKIPFIAHLDPGNGTPRRGKTEWTKKPGPEHPRFADILIARNPEYYSFRAEKQETIPLSKGKPMMRGVNPAHINACFPNLGKGEKAEGHSDAGNKAETSGKKKKGPAYPEQANGILKKGQAAKVAGVSKQKAGTDQEPPGPSQPGPSNAKRVKFNPEPEERAFGQLEDLFSTRENAGSPRLLRTESMPPDMAGPSAPPSSPQSPAGTGEPAQHFRTPDQDLDQGGAKPKRLAEYLEKPLTPSTLSPASSGPSSPTGSFAGDLHIPGTPEGPESPKHRPGRFPGWESREHTPPGSPTGAKRPALPQPPAHLRAGWSESSGSSAGSPVGSVSSGPGTPAHRPDRFEGWDSRDASPAASPRAEAATRHTRTASEVGALFGNAGIEAGNPAGHSTAEAETPPAAGGGRRKPAISAGTAVKVGGAVLAVGVAGMAITGIVMSGQGNDGDNSQG